MSRYGPVPKNRLVIQFRAGVPPAPAWLDAPAKAEYQRAARELKAAGAELQQCDLQVLANYAQAASDIARLTEQLRIEGEILTLPNGIRAAHPAVAVRATAQKHMLQCAAKLGFSPVDRARMPYTPPPAKEDEGQNFANV